MIELINVHFIPYINFMSVMLEAIRMKSFSIQSVTEALQLVPIKI